MAELSDDIYSREKMVLLDEIKLAKRLSQKRNLLSNGDFGCTNNFWENGWSGNIDYPLRSDNSISKGNYVYIPGARKSEINNKVFPMYLYQKVDESKLKPYTRYKVRGLIGGSANLELLIGRYKDEVNTILNVTNDNRELNEFKSQIQYQDSHTFSYHIDTGEVDLNKNFGIWMLFKITSTNGYTTLDNLEIVEERTLVEDEIVNVKKRNGKKSF